MSSISFWPCSGIFTIGIPPRVVSIVFSETIPVIARIGEVVPFKVLSRSEVSLAVKIFRMSVRLAMRLWKPSIKTISRFSFSSSDRILFRSFSSCSVFFMISISWGDMATTTLLPA